MADETIELTEVQAILDGLSSPTDEQFVQAVRAYSDGAVASAAAKRGLGGGGGGGSTKEVTIVSLAALEDAENTPVAVTSAPAAGFMLVPIQVMFSQEGGMTPWTLATPPLVQVTTAQEWLVESNQGTWGRSQRNPFIENGVTTIAANVLFEANDDISSPGADGEALVIVLDQSITGGQARLQVTTWYETVEVPF